MLPPGDWHCTNCSCRYCGLVSDAVPEGSVSVSSTLLMCSQCEKKCMYCVIRFLSTFSLFFIHYCWLGITWHVWFIFRFSLNFWRSSRMYPWSRCYFCLFKRFRHFFLRKELQKGNIWSFLQPFIPFQSFQSSYMLTIIFSTQPLICLFLSSWNIGCKFLAASSCDRVCSHTLKEFELGVTSSC